MDRLLDVGVRVDGALAGGPLRSRFIDVGRRDLELATLARL